jgi:Ca2+:H+ antiporter
MSFFFGGLRRVEQFFNQTVAELASSTLILGAGSLLLPTIIASSNAIEVSAPALLSRIVAIIFLVLYFWYLFYHLKGGRNRFSDAVPVEKRVAMKPRKQALPEGAISKGLAKVGGIGRSETKEDDEDFEALNRRAEIKTMHIEGKDYDHTDRPPNDKELMRTDANEQEDEKVVPELHFMVALFTAAVSITLLVFCCKFMVDQVLNITTFGSISIEFLGLVILPLATSPVELATVVMVAVKDKMDLALGVALSTCIDTILLVFPLVVIVGWILGNEKMTMELGVFPSGALVLAVWMVHSVLGTGRSNLWVGAQMIGAWGVFVVCAWFYKPEIRPD